MYSSVLQKIPLAIVALMMLIAMITIYFRSKNVTRSEFFKICKSVKLLTVCPLFAADPDHYAARDQCQQAAVHRCGRNEKNLRVFFPYNIRLCHFFILIQNSIYQLQHL